MNKHSSTTQKGFTLFVALIVSSILLALGFSLGNIILKELLLSGSAKDSQTAFYAADSGAECALYWDRKDAAGLVQQDGMFAATTSTADATVATPETVASTVKCGIGYDGEGGIGSVTKVVNSDNSAATTTFYINYENPSDATGNSKACAVVTISKNGPFTVIQSRGYNASFVPLTTSGICDISNPRTVERGLRLNY